MSGKTQPWRKAWPPADCQQQQQRQRQQQQQRQDANADADSAVRPIEYGVPEGGIVVVDGTAANVKPAAPLRLLQSEKAQPWKASWTRNAAAVDADADTACTIGNVEYGVAQSETVVVDGTAANVKPSAKVQA